MLGDSIHSLYFQYHAAAWHEPGCPRADTSLWEVTRYTYENFGGEIKEHKLRMTCTECGVSHFENITGEPDRRVVHATEIGWGSKPEKVLGLWLWPGPCLWHGEPHGPSAYYITTTPALPREPEQVAGTVSWGLGPRGAIRWSAGLHLTSHGTVQRNCGAGHPNGFRTRRTAVAWVRDELAAEEAAANGNS